jgi:mono/diheme cytochrome c family protein
MRFYIRLLTAASFVPALASIAAADNAFSPESIEFFEKRIRPILADNCFNCHSANTNSQGGLRLDDRNGQLIGGGSGPALVPGDAKASLLIQVVEHAEGVAKMPPKKKLTEEQITDLKRWVSDGAAWPQPVAPDDINQYNGDYEELRKNHWAWQPIKNTAVPTPNDSAWASTEIDRFIQTGIESNGLTRTAQADKEVLARRLSFDLTGLPPSAEVLDAFVQDKSSDAYDQLVDRLLASSAFGERWGRHWLDVARYGESTGSSRNLPMPHAWRYRDYVINAFNSDKPFNRFITEQIAGDQLPHETEGQREEQLIATGFLAVGVKDVNQRYKVRYVMDNVDEQIDAVSRSFLGVTASCARCHDHKFDPIPTNDYYALAGIFTSTDLCAGLRNKMGGGGLAYYDTDMLISIGKLPDPSGERDAQVAAAKEKFEAAQKEFQSLRNDPAGDQKLPDGRPRRQAARQAMNQAQQALVALSDPALSAKVILGVRDAKKVGDTEVRYRGEAEDMGPKVNRGFLSLVTVPNTPAIPADKSGRLELAQWIANNDNPLTSRVIVNRVWKHLFGRGIVSSVDNFGINGDRPTHAELLDHLAIRFQQNQWSIKSLVREIVRTKTYQLSSEAVPNSISIDPENKWLWRHSPRRLDAEEIRDTTLLIANALELTPPEGSPAKDLKVIELPNNGPIARKLKEAANAATYRSVYLPLIRGITPGTLEVFDAVEQGTVTGDRSVTTVPSQSLFMLNNAFVRKNALKLAEKLLSDATLTDEARVSKAYKRVLGRLPSDTEIAGAISYIREIESVSDLIFELQLKSNAAASNAVASAPSEANSSSVAAIAPTTSNSDDAKPVAKTETAESSSAAGTTSTSDDNQPSPSGDQGGLEIELSFSFKLKSSGKAIVDAKATDTQANRDVQKSAVI